MGSKKPAGCSLLAFLLITAVLACDHPFNRNISRSFSYPSHQHFLNDDTINMFIEDCASCHTP
jgi:hypothetical protein